ncbi:cysteine-rich CWC family protein [Paenibacillus bovis]|uniref:cysteine-rich CWC family protein n=1 Tax=Paenibacillus bovis TaxID=1616788 RepID=UPI0009EBE33F|nr:cysteine-rich CWC family protein [Paenibacillus bovis]
MQDPVQAKKAIEREPKLTADRCPLCGQDNNCTIVKGERPETCWCMHKKIPSNVRSRIPEKWRNQACICESCVDEEQPGK